MALFGNMSGDYMALGSILKEPPELDLDECFFESVEGGKAVMVYGHLSDDPINSKVEIKTKNAEDKWIDYEGKLVRFELPLETIEKEYNGQKKKKEATPQSEFIGKHLLELAGEGKYYKLRIDLGASEEYISSVATGKTRKGTELSEELKAEFMDSIFKVETLTESQHLKAATKGKSGGGGRYVAQGQILDERLAWLSALSQNEQTSKQVEDIAMWLENQPVASRIVNVLALLMS